MRDWRPFVVPAALLLVWELTSALRLLDLEFISRPTRILTAGLGGLSDGSFFRATLQTLEACLFGLSLALVVGVLLGIFLGLSSFAEFVTRPCLEGLRSIPSIAFAPLTLLLFGFGLPMEGLVVAYACLWPILITTIAAVRNVEPRLLEFASTLEMDRRTLIRKIMVPAIFSRVLVGLRTAAGFALVVSVTVEILINPRGLGYGLIISQQSLQIDLMYAYILWLAFVGMIFNALIRLADRDEAAGAKQAIVSILARASRIAPAATAAAVPWMLEIASAIRQRVVSAYSAVPQLAPSLPRLLAAISVLKTSTPSAVNALAEMIAPRWTAARSAAVAAYDRTSERARSWLAASSASALAASAAAHRIASPKLAAIFPAGSDVRRSLSNGLAVGLFTLLFFALWQAVVDFGLVSRIFVAAPLSAFDVMLERIANCSLPKTVWSTGQRLLAGWGAAVVFALAIGTAVGNSRRAYAYLSPTLEFFRPLPASAVIPVAALFFGLNSTMSTFVVAFGSLWPVLLAATHGFANVPRELREVSETLEMSSTRYIVTIAMPSASVDIMAGLRISLSLALILTVVTEMQASLPGLGYEIFAAQRNFRSADLYAGLMTLGIFGYLVNQGLLLAERRLMRWRTA